MTSPPQPQSAQESGNAVPSASPSYVPNYDKLFTEIKEPLTAERYGDLVLKWQQAYQSWLNQLTLMNVMNVQSLVDSSVGVSMLVQRQLVNNGQSTTQTRRQTFARRIRAMIGPDVTYDHIRYRYPAVFKRILAEVIDYFMLLMLRIVLVLLLVFFDPKNEYSSGGVSKNSVIVELQALAETFPNLISFISEEYDSSTFFINILEKAMFVEHVSGFVYVCYETVYLSGVGASMLRYCRLLPAHSPGGATIGKVIMGLKVVSCDTRQLELVDPAVPYVVVAKKVHTTTLVRSFMRALLKNAPMIVYKLPTSLSALFHVYNLAVYDICAGTMVVESQSERILLAQNVNGQHGNLAGAIQLPQVQVQPAAQPQQPQQQAQGQ